MPYLSMQNLSKLYGAETVVQDFSVDVAEGEFMSLLGPSGSGKTSVLRMVAGLVPVDRGRIFLKSRDITHTPARERRFGYVFQSYALFPHLTVRANIAFPLKVRRVSRLEESAAVDRLLVTVGLGEKADRLPHQLSGGEQQRVAIARALAMKPSLLLLDEPLSALDARVRNAMRSEIKRLQREFGVTTLYVTHDQTEAMALSDVVVVLNRGAIEQVGPPREIYHHPASEFVASFVGDANRMTAVVSNPEHGELLWQQHRLYAPKAKGMPAGASCDVWVRPEQIRLGPLGTSSGVPGTLRSIAFHGAYQRLTLRVGEVDLIVDVPASAIPYRPGDAYALAFPDSNA